jgi:hypothetical protein
MGMGKTIGKLAICEVGNIAGSRVSRATIVSETLIRVELGRF